MTSSPSEDHDRPPAMAAMLSDLIEVGRDLWQARLVSSHGGNLSARADDGAVITRHGAMMHRLSDEQFVHVDHDGHSSESWRVHEPSSDTPVHLAVYRAVPEAEIVVHAHPIHAVARSLEWGAITPANISGAILGRVPVLTLEEDETPRAVGEALRESPAVLVRAHGVYARARTPWEALQLVSVLEEAAMILYLAEQ